MNNEQLFWALFNAHTEAAVDQIIEENPDTFVPQNWNPFGDSLSNFGVVENQQASPIPALVEKVVNSLDAILMRRCLESGIDPKSDAAPRSVEEAVQRFFPEASSWDLPTYRAKQAASIQILADGDKLHPSLTIYDDGEGQHPSAFEHTFLSLLRGNKNEIHFVQGKYNMGGAGAIVFCGRKRYQLVVSRRFDASGPLGFTLIRRHPLSAEERHTRKNTWYEYLKRDGQIPAFEPREDLDLRLYGRKFRTGTVVKLYSYDLPSGSRSVISRDLNQSINEYLFQPALPLFTVDRKERYPKDQNLDRDLYGLKRRLEKDESRYIEDYFSFTHDDVRIGRLGITCYVFKPRIEDKDAKESRDTIRREFFKNNMTVLFSINGQVHGHYTSEFITRSLKFAVLKDHVLVHVDCTDVNLEYRNELFMASRDRLKEGEESRELRALLANLLQKSKLKDIYKARRASITVESRDTEDLLKSFTKRLPLQADLVRLLGRTLQLPVPQKAPAKTKEAKSVKNGNGSAPFFPQRFPSFLRLEVKTRGPDGFPLVQIPLGGERTIRFSSDVEDHYFERVDEPGEIKLALLDHAPNQTAGGTAPGLPRAVSEIFNVVRSSPDKGTIRVTLNPNNTAKVGDAVRMSAQLTGAGTTFEQVFWVKVTDPERKTAPQAKAPEPDPNLNLPALILAYREPRPGAITWDTVADIVTLDHGTVMHPVIADEDTLDRVIINMDSGVLLDYKSQRTDPAALEIADKRYISSVYFHTLFLYVITRSRGYSVYRRQDAGNNEEIELGEYLKDVFDTHYSRFLLDFETSDLIAALEE